MGECPVCGNGRVTIAPGSVRRGIVGESGIKRIKSARPEFDSELYRSLFHEVPEAICLTTVNGRIMDINRAGLDLLGLTHREALAANFKDLYAAPQNLREFSAELKKRGSVDNHRTVLKRGDG